MMLDRNNAKRYVFGAALASAAIGGIPSLVQRANAQLVTNAQFTFENVSRGGVFPSSGTGSATFSSGGTTGISTFVNYKNITGRTVLFQDDSGTGGGNLLGSHAASSTVWSTPDGNGSPRSLAATNWSAGDYYQFATPTTGIQNIVISFDQASSGTGPDAFELIAVNFLTTNSNRSSTVGSYAVAVGSFAASASQTALYHAFSLTAFASLGTGLNNNPSVLFDLVALATGTASSWAGVDELDNVTFSGDAITTPEPSTLALASLGAASLLLQRRGRRRTSTKL